MNDKSYKLKTVMDFTKIPEDRIDACLEEFKDCIGHMRLLRTLASDVARMAGAKDVDLGKSYFTWIDDGKRERTLNVRVTAMSEGGGK
ncbi:MAG: hypothetical protein RBU21_04655 [FCB group bacterium]|jgi:hypothetical protein|nr:hypothetical protein [FCB group bacterium]